MLKSPRTGSPRSATDAANRLLVLIRAYQEAAAHAVKVVKSTYGIGNPLEAYHAKRIAKAGSLNANGTRGNYEFHGVGCRFELNGTVVDVDFGPAGRCNGFDVWRLHEFAAHSKGADSAFGDRRRLKSAFHELEQERRIVCPKWEPSPHLYYLASDVADQD